MSNDDVIRNSGSHTRQSLRRVREIKPIVHIIADGHELHRNPVPLLPAGAAVVFYASSGSRPFANLSGALQSANRHELEQIGQVLAREPRLPQQTDEATLRHMAAMANIVFDVTFLGRTVTSTRGLFSPASIGSVVLSSLGKATERDFVIREYVNNAQAPGYEYAVAVNPPKLTQKEIEFLQQTPEVVRPMFIGEVVSDDTFKEVADVVKGMVKEAGATRACGLEFLDRLDWVINQGLISPEAAVSVLIQARQAIIYRSLP
jgi:hypothetical protein